MKRQIFGDSKTKGCGGGVEPKFATGRFMPFLNKSILADFRLIICRSQNGRYSPDNLPFFMFNHSTLVKSSFRHLHVQYAFSAKKV